MHVDIQDIGFVTNSDSCDADLTLYIEEAASPQIQAMTDCFPQGMLAGQSLSVVLTGDTVGDSASGEADMYWNISFSPLDTWSGSFSTATTLDGAFDGAEMMGSAGFTWDATFSVTKQ
jgi:hypothetical protein